MTSHRKLKNFKLPRWKNLPELELYLDQVLSLLDQWLGEYLIFDKDDKVMTKTMINNYVKHGYVPAPVNKKYNKEAMATLIIIALLKPVYTIEEITALIKLSLRKMSMEDAYDNFSSIMESAVRHAYDNTAMPKEISENDPRSICWNVCNAFACQLYVRDNFLKVRRRYMASDSSQSKPKQEV